MNAEFTRDAAAAAAVLAFFASSWFGWAQDRPPGMWWIPLIAGSVLSLLVAAAGAVLAWRHWSDPTGFDADTACSASSWVSSSQLPVWAPSCWPGGAGQI